MAYMDMGPITTVVKSALPPPPQAQPSVAETMKPVPETEIQAPVPPPAKGAQPGLGEHLDLYDTEKPPIPAQPTESKAQPAESKAQKVIPDDAPTREVQAEIVRAAKSDKSDKSAKAAQTAKAAQAEQAEQTEKDKAASEADLLGNGTGLPQPTIEPVHLDLPFLKPLGRLAPLGQAIDERV
jgi:hypothetical protein